MNPTIPTQQPLVKVHLHGALAAKFGDVHEFAIRTPREAVQALDANFPGFYKELIKVERYVIVADDEVRDGDSAVELTFVRDLHLIPAIEGQASLGALAIGALFGIAATSVTATVLGGLLVTGIVIGLSLLLKPKQPEQKQEDQTKDDSYAFSGPENVTEQGAAVPLIYGRVYTGSVVISAGLSVADVAIT